jgi:hypothetical protein
MTSQIDLRRDFAVLAEQIAQARIGLTRNELIDINEIPEKVRVLAGAITDLAPEEASEMRPLLMELLSEFKDFSNEVREKIAAIQSQETSAGRSAT